jgi:hypothetical protein
MKKIVAVLSLALVASSAMADGYHHHHGGYYRGYSGWVGPAIVGGVLGYAIAQPRTVVVQQQPPVVYQPAPVVVQQNQQVCETKLMVDPWGVQRMATVCYQQ